MYRISASYAATCRALASANCSPPSCMKLACTTFHCATPYAATRSIARRLGAGFVAGGGAGAGGRSPLTAGRGSQRVEQVVDRLGARVVEGAAGDDLLEDVHRLGGQVVGVAAVLGEADDVAEEDRLRRLPLVVVALVVVLVGERALVARDARLPRLVRVLRLGELGRRDEGEQPALQ